MPEDRKTRATDADVDAFLASVADERRRRDAEEALALLGEVTGAEPVMWGASMVGFGRSTYRTADGEEHEWFVVGLSPRKTSLTLYGLLDGGADEELLGRLGPHRLGKGCVYLNRLDDVDRTALAALVRKAWSRRGGSGPAAS